MESILEKLLVSDSKCVQEGTRELKKAFEDPSCLSTLCEILVTNQRADIRHITVVLLRRKFSKRRMWIKLKPEMRNLIKQGMLSALVNEADKSVKTGIAQLLGQLGKFELADDSWPELFEFIFRLICSENLTDRELGMYTLSITTEMSHGSYIKYFSVLAPLFKNIINVVNDYSSNLAYNILKTLKNLIPAICAHDQMLNVYYELLPHLLRIMKALATVDEHKCIEALGMLEDLIDYTIVVVMPHVDDVVRLCLGLACDNSVPIGAQVKAISIIGWLVKARGKVFVKHQLIPPIIDVLMELMARDTENQQDEEYFAGDSDQLTPVTVATQALDLIALNIPADKVVPYVLEKIEPSIQGNDANRKKAAFLCLAVLAEGCSECIRKKYLAAFIDCVCEAIKDNNNLVKNAAFFALGQFSEHLQPEVSGYSDKLMPLLLELLNHVYIEMEKDKTEPNCLDRLFYAIATFCENLGEGLLLYLPLLMERLLQGLNPQGWSTELKKSCFSSLEAVVTAVKLGILPYFPQIIEILNVYISAPEETDNYELQSYAIDCLAVIADGVGEEHFKPLANNSLQMALKLIDTHDPDVRRAIFALLGSLASIVTDEIIAALPKIVQEILTSLQCSDGIVTYYEDDEKKNECDVFGQSSESEENSDEEDIGSEDSEETDRCKYSVENPFAEEKEQACITLKEICAQTKKEFLPYLDKCIEEVLKLMAYPRDHIRKAAIETGLQFCITLYQIDMSETTQMLYKILHLFIPKCSEIIRTDEEKGVATAGLDAFSTLLKEIKRDAFVGNGHKEAIMNSVIDVLTLKTICQDNDFAVLDMLDGFEESTDAEQEEILLESACDIIPKFGRALNPEDFVQYFENVLNLLSLRTTKKHSIAQRSFSYGTLAECMSCLGIYVERFVPRLMELWFAGMKDHADEVRNNSVFGLGEMVLHGREKILNYYPDILQALSELVNKEPHEGTLDNICGAIAKIIIINHNGIPLNQVFPVFLDRLPLRVDFEENESVVKCFFVLYQGGSEILKINIGKVTRILIHILTKDQAPNDDTKIILLKILKSIHSTFTEEFNAVVQELTQDKVGVLQQALE